MKKRMNKAIVIGTDDKDQPKKKLSKKQKCFLIILFILALIALSFGVVYAIELVRARMDSPTPVRHNNDLPVARKPIIYLYPQENTEVEVRLGRPEKLTTTYPRYDQSWRVLAQPNGDLKDLKTGRNLYSLYWEGADFPANLKQEGFVVGGDETIEFLEGKLATLGLNEHEAQEFIIYWLPKIQKNKYNYVRFASSEEIEDYMPLNINPKPDTIIRVMMLLKPLDEAIEVKEQLLQPAKRSGFTVVEWGGSILQNE